MKQSWIKLFTGFVLVTIPFNKIFAWEKDSVQPISPCVSEIFLPKVFTGSGDGIYDYFIPRLSGNAEAYEFTIYNRWGAIIFQTKELNRGWDGTKDDKAQADGTYFWSITFTCAGSKEEYTKTGHVMLVR